jgi:hypothetical protein
MQGPGLFLQGLATYGPAGEYLPGPLLERTVVRRCLQYALDSGIACTAFLGDTCAAPFVDAHLERLHSVYYEPPSQVRAPQATVAVAGTGTSW